MKENVGVMRFKGRMLYLLEANGDLLVDCFKTNR
jgi:hypothetical protein